jgi:hypothetical protein
MCVVSAIGIRCQPRPACGKDRKALDDSTTEVAGFQAWPCPPLPGIQVSIARSSWIREHIPSWKLWPWIPGPRWHRPGSLVLARAPSAKTSDTPIGAPTPTSRWFRTPRIGPIAPSHALQPDPSALCWDASCYGAGARRSCWRKGVIGRKRKCRFATGSGPGVCGAMGSEKEEKAPGRLALRPLLGTVASMTADSRGEMTHSHQADPTHPPSEHAIAWTKGISAGSVHF